MDTTHNITTVMKIVFFSIFFIAQSHALKFKPIEAPNGKSNFVTNISANGQTIIGFEYDINKSTKAFKLSRNYHIRYLEKISGNSQAVAVNDSGDIVVGNAVQEESVKNFIWFDNKAEDLFFPENKIILPIFISKKGKIIIGNSKDIHTGKIEPFIWQNKTGINYINQVIDDNQESELIYSNESASRMVVNIKNNTGYASVQLIDHQKTSKLETLGGMEITALSANETYIIGRSFTKDDLEQHAFIWSQKDGIQDLGTLGGNFSAATGMSADGSIVVGYSEDVDNIMQAFIWEKGKGMTSIKDYLITHGVQHMQGRELQNAIGVSGDGGIIIGNGINTEGKNEAWVINLRE